MEQLEFKNLMNHLIDVGLHFEPKDLNKLFNIWYPVLNNYSDSELKQAISNWLLQQRNFPTLSELLQQLEIRKLGIADVRMFLFNYKTNKELIYKNYSVKMQGKTAKEKRKLVMERKEAINSLIPPQINDIISAYGGDIENIIKYNLKDFKNSLMLEVKKIITNKNKKLLEER